jgi:uncharacterized protein YacL
LVIIKEGGDYKLMVKNLIRGLLTTAGLVIGYQLVYVLGDVLAVNEIFGILIDGTLRIVYYVIGALLFGLIFFLISPWLIKLGWKATGIIENTLQNIPTNDILLGSVGLILGLIIANLFIRPLAIIPIPWLGSIVMVLANIILGYLGIKIATRKRDDLGSIVHSLKKLGIKDKNYRAEGTVRPKILDTSVIIDGRIADICKTGFVEGPLIIPGFVLEELRHIADSSDTLKRNRGRRGLDILNKIQKELDIPVKIYDKPFEDIAEVDTKLLKLAQIMKGKVVTNDFNLNKVAEFQGVPVLNINELANAVKPVVLPGEEMVVQVIKDGKESGQGVAYLDDGTMIVVDGGKKHIGESIGVMVTSVLQTAAGRMIFAKPKNALDNKAV